MTYNSCLKGGDGGNTRKRGAASELQANRLSGVCGADVGGGDEVERIAGCQDRTSCS